MNTDSLPRLLAIMQRLRDRERGCPWDLEQTFASLAPYTLEEAGEVADALERGDLDDLRDELGDLLFQVVFLAQLASEDGRFDFGDVAAAIADKLERRHPHVFGPEAGGSLGSGAVLQRWEQLKAGERAARGLQGALDGVSRGLPALLRATKLGKRAARVGFDWADAHGARAKIDEELAEVSAAVRDGDGVAVEEEIGDLLLATASWARLLGCDPERALRTANRKFEDRFACMERDAAAAGLRLEMLDATALDQLWARAKAFSNDSSRQE